MNGDEPKFTVEEVDSVPTPPRAEVVRMHPVEAETDDPGGIFRPVERDAVRPGG